MDEKMKKSTLENKSADVSLMFVHLNNSNINILF